MFRLLLKSAEGRLVKQLTDTLGSLPDIELDRPISGVLSPSTDKNYDAKVRVHIHGQPITIFVDAKRTAYPRDVQQALWRAKLLKPQDKNHHSVVLLAAMSLSPGAKELLRAEGMGYFDSGGSLYVPATGAYIFIDKPPPKAQASAMRLLFTGRRAQVIHALLTQREQWFSVKDLAALSQVSTATASAVLTELEKFEWIEVRGQGPNKERHLRDARALLDAWAAQVIAERAPALHRYYVPGLKADALMDQAAQALAAHNANYAFSHEAAAQRYAPYLSSVTQVRCRMLLSAEANDALADLGARAVNEGANFVVIEAKSPGDLLFSERVDKLWLASPIHVYLDLLKSEGRAKEMAEHLRNQKIGC